MRQSETEIVKIRCSCILTLMFLWGCVDMAQSCNKVWGRYYQMDFSHLDNLDASRHPTLSEKIRSVITEHYGGGGWSPSQSVGGGSYKDHNHHTHGWSNGDYEYAANNHQKPVVVPPVSVPSSKRVPLNSVGTNGNMRRPGPGRGRRHKFQRQIKQKMIIPVEEMEKKASNELKEQVGSDIDSSSLIKAIIALAGN